MESKNENILIIKHGAFGDFVMAFGPFQTIRKAHPKAKLTLLTTKAYAGLAQKSGLFNEIWIDERPKFWQLKKITRLLDQICDAHFSAVYDLQTSDRSGFYFWLMKLKGQKPSWSGIAKGCSHPDTNPERRKIHTLDRQKEQLRLAGLKNYLPPNLSFLDEPTDQFNLKAPFILFVPGCAPHRPEKRWPHYGELAKSLINEGFNCVAIGGPSEQELTKKISQALSKEEQKHFYDLAGETSFDQIATLARQAAGAVGNDTGPMHLIATSNCASVTLFSANSDPKRCAPRGAHSTFLQVKDLKDLPATQVSDTLKRVLKEKEKHPHENRPGS